LRKELVALETQKYATLGYHSGGPMNHLPIYEMASSHDTINRYLKGEKLTPHLLFEQVQPLLEPDPEAYLIFDDTVLDKSFGPSIELTRKQWSGNEKRPIRGIGVVSCV
jgi:hypothetical protein